jgi:DNA-binding XRE family transcriptional regulator
MKDSVNQRVKYLIDHYGYNRSSFSKKIGAASTTIISMLDKGTNPNVDTVVKILNAFPLVNTEWLITGKGEFEKSTYKNESVLLKVEEAKSKMEVLHKNDAFTTSLIDLLFDSEVFKAKIKELVKKENPVSYTNEEGLDLINEIEKMARK